MRLKRIGALQLSYTIIASRKSEQAKDHTNTELCETIDHLREASTLSCSCKPILVILTFVIILEDCFLHLVRNAVIQIRMDDILKLHIINQSINLPLPRSNRNGKKTGQVIKEDCKN